MVMALAPLQHPDPPPSCTHQQPPSLYTAVVTMPRVRATAADAKQHPREFAILQQLAAGGDDIPAAVRASPSCASRDCVALPPAAHRPTAPRRASSRSPRTRLSAMLTPLLPSLVSRPRPCLARHRVIPSRIEATAPRDQCVFRPRSQQIMVSGLQAALRSSSPTLPWPSRRPARWAARKGGVGAL